MIQIRFRAWDIQNERMVYDPDRFEPSCSEDEKVISPWVFYETWQDREDGIGRSCQLMQFTGLLDKNGKEIYEGDIVKCHDHPTGIEDCTTSVVFSHGSFVAKYNGILLSDYGTAWTEVIGNVFENPELLK